MMSGGEVVMVVTGAQLGSGGGWLRGGGSGSGLGREGRMMSGMMSGGVSVSESSLSSPLSLQFSTISSSTSHSVLCCKIVSMYSRSGMILSNRGFGCPITTITCFISQIVLRVFLVFASSSSERSS